MVELRTIWYSMYPVSSMYPFAPYSIALRTEMHRVLPYFTGLRKYNDQTARCFTVNLKESLKKMRSTIAYPNIHIKIAVSFRGSLSGEP